MTSKVAARPERKSFSRLDQVLDVPNLIDIQKASFSWFMEEGLRETIEDISPIEDYTGTLAVEFGSYAFGSRSSRSRSAVRRTSRTRSRSRWSSGS